MADGTQATILRSSDRQRLHIEKFGAESALREAMSERASITEPEFDIELDRLQLIAAKIADFVRDLEADFTALDGSRDIMVRGFGTVFRRQQYDATSIAEAVALAFDDELTAAASNYLVAAVRAEVG